MRFWERFRKQRATAGVLGVLLLVMLLSLVACLGIYGYARDALTQATISAGEQTLTQLLNSSSSAWEDAQQLLLQLSMNKEVRQYRYDPQVDELGERYWSYPLMTTLRETLLFHQYLDNIYLYYPGSNVVLGNLSILQDGTWLNEEVLGGLFENEEALGVHLAKNNSRATPIRVQSADGGQILVLWGRGVYNTYTSSDVYIFLPLNIDRLAAEFDAFLQSPNACTAFYIVDETGELVISRGNIEAIPDVAWDSLGQEAQRGIIEVDGSVLLHGKSVIQGWRFVFIYSPEVFWWQTRMMGTISAFLIAFYILVALSIGVFYYRWNKRQVGQILKTLEDNTGPRDRRLAGEYQSIQGGLLELVHQHKDLRAQAHSQTVRLRRATLQNLITGRIGQQGFRLADHHETLDLHLEDTHFAVLVVACPVEQSVLYADSVSLEENEQLLHFAMENIAEELLAPLGRVYALEYNEYTVVVVNLYARDLAPLRTASAELLQTFQRYLQAPAIVALSGLQDGVRNIQYAYQEAMEAMEYASGNRQPFCAYMELPDAEDGQAGGFSLLAEQQLLGCIRTAQADKAEELIEQILCQDNASPARRQRYLYVDVACALIKAAEELRSHDQKPYKLGELYDLLTQQEHPQEVLVFHARKLCEMAERVMQHNRPLTENITAYIDAHYQNPDLNVSELGKSFHRAPSYLSRLYKEATGIALMEQIASVRMAHAKTLLEQDTPAIQEVAVCCGYYDYSSFARVFKKHHGISPKQYRQMHLAKDLREDG